MWTDPQLHVRGQTVFTADLPEASQSYHLFPVTSTLACGRILSLDFNKALQIPGVVKVLTAADIPGVNGIGHSEEAEVLLAEQEVSYYGQAVALVIAISSDIARQAADCVQIEYEASPGVFEPRQADEQKLWIGMPRVFCVGQPDECWAECDVIVTGNAQTGAQEHLYFETQSAIAWPVQQGLKVYSATQSPGMVQKIIARLLDWPMQRVEVEVMQLGGGFGGKEEQATFWAACVALASQVVQKPVMVHLTRDEDMRFTGKRHPYEADFKIGFSSQGRILAYEVSFYQDAGAWADLSPAILERTLLHVTNTYCVPQLKVIARSCRTNLIPNTAFRGFGAPQAMFVFEAALFKAAQALGMPYEQLQQLNLLKTGDTFPYGMPVTACVIQECWDQLWQRYEIVERFQAIDEFNQNHIWQKKALSIMPICFGISFTARFLNQASALVHIYQDGTVLVSTGAVEMGQGVKTKLIHIVARVFSIPENQVRIASTNTARIANMSPTAASTGADLNGQATLMACQQLKQHLSELAQKLLGAEAITFQQGVISAEGQEISWSELIAQAYLQRLSLSALAHYATPGLDYDRAQDRGQPFAYHVYGVAAVEVTLDTLRATYQFEQVFICHDAGQSLDASVDQGQVEGALVQGLGWLTVEDIRYSKEGRLLTSNLTDYKIPDLYFAPEIHIHWLENSPISGAVMRSKAVGEPPFMYGIGGYFALIKAMQAFNPDIELDYVAPLTPERVLMTLYKKRSAEGD